MAIQVLKDLRFHFGPARDQGQRPTCLAFAASDAHAALRTPWQPLSCEYAFYHAQRRAGRSPSKGAVLPHMLSALKADGQPAETTWPYLDALPTDSSGYGPPSNVTVFRRDGEPRRECLDEIIARLDANKPVLVLMMLSDAFYLPNNEGVITAPASEQPDPLRRHAVVAVGYGQIGGARAILIRNSWGKDWGVAGHAWLPEAFIAPRLTRVALLTEEIHVPTKNLAA